MIKEILELLKIATRNNFSFAINVEYAAQLYNYINNLQQRIDKTLTTIDEMINGTYILQNEYTHVCYNKDESSTIRLKIIKKILQGDE